MKIARYTVILALIAAALPLDAAVRKGADHQKSRIKPAGTSNAVDLRTAGPVWKKPVPLRAAQKYTGSLQRAYSPTEKALALAAERGLTVRELQLAENGTIAFISGDLGGTEQLPSVSAAAAAIPSAVQSAAALRDLQLAQRWLETFAPAMKLNHPAAELSLSRHETDELGMRHLRLQQTFKGIPVWANELYVHLDAANQVYVMNGRYAPTPAAIDPDAAVIDGARAIELGRAHLAAEGRLRDIPANMNPLMRFFAPKSQKAIWMDKQGAPHLVWQVDIYANIRDWFTIMVDALSGEVLHKYSNTMSEGSVNASGVDLGGSTRSFRAYEENGAYYMLSDLNELSGGSTNLPDSPTGGLWVIDLRNTDASETSQFYHVTSSTPNSWSDRSAVSALHNLNQVYAYYSNTHGRRAIDANASTIVTVVNVTEDGQAMDNAYWNGAAIFWGNGSDYFTPLAEALDVAAHELTHGVTEYTANLVYQDQPGALNESMSDFFGCMVDRDDWLMREDIMRPGMGSALRDISHPHNANVLSQMPKTMDEYEYTSDDNGGVHTNCALPLYASYMITTAIGREKAEKIYYRALSKYLTRQSQFIDARTALEQSATDLYGAGSELSAVQSAFDAVKVKKSGSGGGGTTTPRGAGDNEVEATTGGQQWIAFVGDDNRLGLYNVTTEQDYLLDITVNSKQYNWTQFSATADGHYLYFINSNGVLSRLDCSSLASGYYNYETFPEYTIHAQGDLWNAAVSRDGQYIALTSVYENDNNIYLLISNQLYSIPLEIPSTQEGISGTTIQYPDVITWSPNAKYPKLAFDAYNEFTLSTGVTRDWWSMGEVDFTGENAEVYSLLPAQPIGISVGNIQYSSTDPDYFAYSYIQDESNTWDIKLVNFAETGQDGDLIFKSRDVERPSFSPDDKYLVIDRFSDGKLLIVDIAGKSYFELDLSSGARYPEWFVVGGSYDLEVEANPAEQPGEFFLEANYPNPFNAGTLISYTLRQQSRVRVAVYDVQGRLVKLLQDGIKTAGRHSISWQGGGADGQPLASGIYLCKLEAEGGFSASRKMLLVK